MNQKKNKGKAIIFSAPSGAGKTTIVKKLLETKIPLMFSISACSRLKRRNEKDGIDYHFLSVLEFQKKIKNNEFIEWEEVYENNFYGTMKKEIERIWESGKHVVFDVDVVGGISLKKYFGESAISIFINPPSLDILFERLKKRATDNKSSLQKRMNKAIEEIKYKDQFDKIINNDKLDIAINETVSVVENFIYKS
jgi:guanylate kinase